MIFYEVIKIKFLMFLIIFLSLLKDFFVKCSLNFLILNLKNLDLWNIIFKITKIKVIKLIRLVDVKGSISNFEWIRK